MIKIDPQFKRKMSEYMSTEKNNPVESNSSEQAEQPEEQVQPEKTPSDATDEISEEMDNEAEAAIPEGDSESQADEDSEDSVEVIPLLDLQQQLADSQKELEELRARLRSVSAAYTRQGDEIKATKLRLERQMQYKESQNRGEVVSALFEPFDNLKRSLEGFKKSDIESSHVEALEMVQSSFFEAFKKLGLEELPGKGSKFDPNIHEALINIPVPDPALDGVVIDVHSTGYRINDIIIKSAKVIVGQCDQPTPEEPEESEGTPDEVPTDMTIDEESEQSSEANE